MLYLEGFDEFCEGKFLLSRILDLLSQLLLLPFQLVDLPLLFPSLLFQVPYFKLQLRFLTQVRLKGLFETLKFIQVVLRGFCRGFEEGNLLLEPGYGGLVLRKAGLELGNGTIE